MSPTYHPDQRLRPLLQRLGDVAGAELTPIDDLKKDIHRYGKRRCDVEASVDNLKYYVGFAFEVNGALDLPSFALTGLLSMPATAFADLFANDDDFAGTVLDMLRRALANPMVLDWSLRKRVWLQWKHSEAIYRAEVTDFKGSDAFHRKGWRTRPVTRSQFYLIGEIKRLLGVEPPAIVNRGQAFEFIDRNGGNPRFRNEPALPAQWWS